MGKSNLKSLMKDIEIIKSLQTVSFHTGTLYDLLTGNVINTNGRWHVDGGFSNLIHGIGGYTNSYKSTLGASLITRSLDIYPDADAVILDTENALIRDLKRLARFAPSATSNILDRIYPLSGANYDLASFFTFLRDLCKTKEKHRKDYTIETNIIDPNTGKLGIAWVPTYVFIDSLTELECTEERELLEKEGLDSGKSKTSNMVDGLKKTQLIRTLRKYCERYGIILICAAQIDQTIDMGGMFSSKPKKQLQHMKVGEEFKNCGTALKKLATTIIQAAPAKFLDDKPTKTSYYPDGVTPWKDVNEVNITTTRCKSQNDGIVIPLVVSQTYGMLRSLTDFHYLRHENLGVAQSAGRYRIDLYPDTTVTRKTIREEAKKSAEYKRALQLSAELAFVKKYYGANVVAMDTDISHKDLYTKLKDLGVYNDILNTRGYWTYDKTDKRTYCNIFDILSMVKDKSYIKQIFK